MKKFTVFFETSLRVRLAQDPLLLRSAAMEFAMQLPLRCLGFPARTSREDPVPGDCLERYFDGCSGESNALERARKRAARVEARLSLVTDSDVGVAVQFFEKGREEYFAEFVTSFNLITSGYHSVGLHEPILQDEIVVTVRVRRGRTVQRLLDDTGRHKDIDAHAIATMPLIAGEGEEEVEFVFFREDRISEPWNVEAERRKRGLVQDLEAQIQCNIDDPVFADDHPNGDVWPISFGEYDVLSFMRITPWDTHETERHVRVGRFLSPDCRGDAADDEQIWWGGARKKSPVV